MEYLDSEVYLAPILINMLCRIFPMGFYDPDSLEELVSSVNNAINEIYEKPNSTKKDKVDRGESIVNKLEGYDLSIVVLTFFDNETNEKIADCSSKGKDDLSFGIYRQYDSKNTLMGIKIGVYGEE